jgi:hypothetical protein
VHCRVWADQPALLAELLAEEDRMLWYIGTDFGMFHVKHSGKSGCF